MIMIHLFLGKWEKLFEIINKKREEKDLIYN